MSSHGEIAELMSSLARELNDAADEIEAGEMPPAEMGRKTDRFAGELETIQSEIRAIR